MVVQQSIFKTLLIKSFGILLVLFLTACEDPTSVGLDLVGDDSGEPITKRFDLTSFQEASDNGIVDNTGQVLAGMVNDPTMGSLSVEGYFDVRTNTDRTSDYRDGTIEKALLNLETSYMYGDTLEQITFGLHEVLSEFSALNTTTDSIPEIGPEILQFTMLPTDSIVTVELPEGWITAHDVSLREEDFDDLYHGFKLTPIAGNAVVGFHNAITRQTAIKGIVGTDTVSYTADKRVTFSTRTVDATTLPERILFQRGVGPKIRLNFDLASLQDVSLNRVALRVPFDTDAFDTPSNFFRPEIENLSLYGVLSDSTTELLAISQNNEEGFYDFVSETFHSVVQQFILGFEPYEAYEIRFPVTSNNSIDALILYDQTSVVETPGIFFTYTLLN